MAESTEQGPHFLWQDKPIVTMGDISAALAGIETPEQAKAFGDAFRAVSRYADSNIRWVIGYFDAARRRELMALFNEEPRMKHCSLCAKDYPATDDTWHSECPACIEHSNQMRERRDAILAEKRGKP